MATKQGVLEATDVFDVLCGSTAVLAGQLVYDDGTDWELSDGNSAASYAMGVAVSDAPIGGVLKVARAAVLFDPDDNAYSSSTFDTLYLSGTAGGTTATRLTGANDLVQVVGHAYQHGDFHGVGLDDTNAAVGASFMVPQNCIGVEIAYSWHAGTGVVLDASDTVTFDVSAGVDDETTSATTDGITATALTVAANDLARIDITTAFDAAGIIEPGNVIGLDIKKAAEGAGGDDPIMLCSSVVLNVV